MSFFDEVETTVANTRFLQAVENSGPVKLTLTPFEELNQLEEKIRSRLSHETLLKPKTTGYYLLKKWLQEQYTSLGKPPRDISSFFDAIDEFRDISLAERKSKATQIIQEFLNPPNNEDNARAPASTTTSTTTSTTSSTSICATTTTTATIENDQKDGTEAAKMIQKDNDEEKEDKEEKYNSHQYRSFPEIFRRSPDAQDILEQMLRDCSSKSVSLNIFDRTLVVVGQSIEKLFPQFRQTDHYRQYVQLQHYKHQKVHLKDFRVFRVLGRGAFGAVSAVQKMDTHAIFAMKEMGKKQVKQSQSEWMCINEKKVLSKMCSPFVLNLKYSFHDDENLYLIFDMCGGGDLKFHLRNGKESHFSNQRAQFYAAQVLCGLEHIHSFDIVYRDLKPTNLLLDQKGNVKISDLGLTIKLRKNKVLKHLAGTAGYWAPEIVKKAGTYKVSDYWSFGVFLFEMLRGKRPRCNCRKGTKEWCPFGQKPSMEENAKSKDGNLKIELDYPPDYFTPEIRDLLSKLFEVDPKLRLGVRGADEIKSHPYFDPINWNQLIAGEIEPPFVPDPHTVHANSIGEVGEFNKNKYRKIKLTGDDHKHYRNFTYTSDRALEEELTQALIKIDNPPEISEQQPLHTDGCCCLLS